MAIFHLSCKAIQRRAGRSAVAAAAYRAAIKIVDERTGMRHDYTRKRGCSFRAVVTAAKDAPVWVHDRSLLWNRAEAAEKRGDACTAHEIEIALPHEASAEERQRLATKFAKHVSEKFGGVVVDVAIHEPQQKAPKESEGYDPSKGDSRNHHAHLLITERAIEGDGFAKTKGRHWNGGKGKETVEELRADYAAMCNELLAAYNTSVDHRSHRRRGITTAPTTHDGCALTGAIRRDYANEATRKALEATIAALKTPCPPIAVDAATGAICALQTPAAWATRANIDPLDELNRYQPPTHAAAAERDFPALFEAPLFSPFAAVRRASTEDDEDDERKRYEEARRRLADAAPDVLDEATKRTAALFEDDAPTDAPTPDDDPTPAPPRSGRDGPGMGCP